MASHTSARVGRGLILSGLDTYAVIAAVNVLLCDVMDDAVDAAAFVH